jgi:hypothetical protein
VTIDNSNCDNDVKELKFKLVCKFTVRKTDQTIEIKDYYQQVDRFPGVQAGQKVKRMCPIEFPSTEDLTYPARIHPDQHQFGLLPCSYVGKTIAIEYFLKCFIKHDAWNDFGEGKFVILPIQLDYCFKEKKSKIA